MRRPNAWHQAIVFQLQAAGESLTVEQIWRRLEASGFQHKSVMPRSTLGARIAELVQMKKLSRVGPATYQVVVEEASGTCQAEEVPAPYQMGVEEVASSS